MSESPIAAEDAKGRFVVDPYLDWAKGESIPIHQDFGLDLLGIETARWDRYDAKGCFAHCHGRGDFMANYVLEIEPGKRTRPVKHLYEAFIYVLKGVGTAKIWMPNGEEQLFEFGMHSLFAIPLNAEYQIFNGSGRDPVRLSVTNDAPIVMNLFHSEDFVFNNTTKFPERFGSENLFRGEGELLTLSRGTGVAQLNIWETNFVPDVTSFKLYELNERGKGSLNVSFVLADSTMHAHCSQIPTGRYKKAHRHAAGTHVHAVDGEGYSLLWYEGESDFKEIPWRHGIMYVPPFWMFHQHFNTCEIPARYLACSIGSARYPFISLRRVSNEGGGSTSVKQGGRQIEYEDQDHRIHRKFLEALKKSGQPSLMGDIFDEEMIMKIPADQLKGVISTPELKGPAI
jgi:uncharacterized RmlC-like cupin family protein